ncbi:hypothetical protein NQZ79_g1876 [Umbelopsis isabellina]|nr:hypothetical protein NQZ79_g1876 [Umbelopsis isabellina]
MKLTTSPQDKFNHFNRHVERPTSAYSRNSKSSWTKSRCKSPLTADLDSKQTHSCSHNKRRRTRPCSQDDLAYRSQHSPALNEDCLLELRRQAFSELHIQTQAYNDTFVARMQHLESLPQEEQRHLWAMLGDHDHNDKHDKDAQAVLEIIDMLDRNSMNDYGAYLERLQGIDDPLSSPEHDVGDFW